MIKASDIEVEPGILIEIKNEFRFREKTLPAGEIIMFVETGLEKNTYGVTHGAWKKHVFLASDGKLLTYLTVIDAKLFVLYNIKHRNFKILTK